MLRRIVHQNEGLRFTGAVGMLCRRVHQNEGLRCTGIEWLSRSAKRAQGVRLTKVACISTHTRQAGNLASAICWVLPSTCPHTCAWDHTAAVHPACLECARVPELPPETLAVAQAQHVRVRVFPPLPPLPERDRVVRPCGSRCGGTAWHSVVAQRGAMWRHSGA